MFASRKSFIILALILVLAVSGGGLLHALVPHAHGDDHSSGRTGETIIWQMLHSVAHHDKKVLFAQVEPLVLALVAMILLSALNAVGSILYTREFSDPRVNDGRMSALRRGVFRYRVFV